MDFDAFQGAFVISTIAGGTAVAIHAANTAVSGDAPSLFTSMGVFGAALGIAYYMLRRGDKREHDMMEGAREDAALDKRIAAEALALVAKLQAEIDELRKKR